MNEWIFCAHLLVLVGFLLSALRLGSAGLSAFIALQAVFANLFVVKQMQLFGLNVTCSDAFAVGGLLALNLLQEFFGKEAAKRAMWISLLAAVFFAVMAEMHLFYMPSPLDGTQNAFQQIFSFTPRIVFASIAVFFLVQQIDVRIFGWMQKHWQGRRLALRVAISLFLSQTIDTVLFSFAGLYGIVDSVFDVIVMSLPIKWIAIACSAPFAHVCRKVFRERYDRI